jgi:hypothetical protein
MNFIKKLTGESNEKDSGCCCVEIKEVESKEDTCCGSDNEEDNCCA